MCLSDYFHSFSARVSHGEAAGHHGCAKPTLLPHQAPNPGGQWSPKSPADIEEMFELRQKKHKSFQDFIHYE